MKRKMDESKAIQEVRVWKKKVAIRAKKLRGKALFDFYNAASFEQLLRTQPAKTAA